jgi:surface carbohydrate biosynthesis protein
MYIHISLFCYNSEVAKIKKKYCYLQYEIDKRELRSRIFLASRLIPLNETIYIFQHSQLARIAFFYPKGSIFLKSTPPAINFLIILLRFRGFKIGLWQEEGIHFKDTDKGSPIFSRLVSKYIDTYFAWHPDDANFAIKQGINPEHIKTVGNVRMELASQVLNSRNTNINDSYTILLVTNFDTSLLKYNFKEDGNISAEIANKENSNARKYNSIAANNLRLYQTLIDHNSAEKYRFILRPYVFERATGLVSDKIVIDQNVSIFETFKEIDLIIHYGSTAGIEGIYSGIPSIILSNDVSLVDYRILNSSELFSDCSELYSFLDRTIINRGDIDKLSQFQISKATQNYDFDFSNSEHSEFILRFVSEGLKQSINYYILKDLIKEFPNYFQIFIKSKIMNFFSINTSYKSQDLDINFIENEFKDMKVGRSIRVRTSRNCKIMKIYPYK